MSIQVTFPGGVQVATKIKSHTILTDQPTVGGGKDEAPAPFDLFLASLATCAGFYALRFCQERQIDTGALGVEMDWVKNPETKHIDRIDIRLELPDGFPEKYHAAILRAVDQCAVKRHILEPPKFEVSIAELTVGR